MTLGGRIKLLISDLNMNQKEFAKSVGLDEQTLSRICNDKGNPTMRNINLIIQTYPDVNLEWVFRGNGQMWKGSTDPQTSREIIVIDAKDKSSMKKLKKMLNEIDEDE